MAYFRHTKRSALVYAVGVNDLTGSLSIRQRRHEELEASRVALSCSIEGSLLLSCMTDTKDKECTTGAEDVSDNERSCRA